MKMAEVMTLFDYNYWATGRVLDAAANLRPEQFVGKPDGYPSEVAALLTTYGESPGDLDFLFFVLGRG